METTSCNHHKLSPHRLCKGCGLSYEDLHLRPQIPQTIFPAQEIGQKLVCRGEGKPKKRKLRKSGVAWGTRAPGLSSKFIYA